MVNENHPIVDGEIINSCLVWYNYLLEMGVQFNEDINYGNNGTYCSDYGKIKCKIATTQQSVS